MQKLTLFVASLLLAINLSAQNKSSYFKTIPALDQATPEWANKMYADDPNVPEVDFLYAQHYQNNPFEKNIHTQNYKFWRRIIESWINPDGLIRRPSKKELAKELSLMKAKKAKRTTNSLLRSNVPGTWTSIGPFETYSTGSDGIPVSWQANVYSIDQSKSNPDILYGGSESGGVFKTTDKGMNWSLVSLDESFVNGILCVKIHPTNPDIVYIAGNERIYKSTDGGTNWNEIYDLNAAPQRLFIHQRHPDTLFCAANNGFYRSYNGGTNWTRIFTDQSYDIECHPNRPDTLYLLKNDAGEKRSEFFRSVDGGANWIQQTTGWYSPSVLSEARNGGARMAVTPASPDLVYVALIGESKANDNGWIGVYKSTNSGSSWNNPNLPDGGPFDSSTHPNLATINPNGTGFNQGFYNFAIAVSHNDPNKVWVGNLSLFESTDGAATWSPLGGYAGGSRLSWIHPDIQDLHVMGDDVWVASDGGINYSNDDLVSHSSRKYGLIGSEYWGFSSGWNEDVLVGGRYHNGNSGYYQTYGLGNSLRLGGGEAPTGYVNPLKKRTAYFSDISTKHLPTSLFGDVTSSPSLSMYPNEHYWEAYSGELEFDPRYANHLYLGKDDGFWKSTDGGANFSKLFTFPANSRVQEIEISRSNPLVMYAEVKNTPGGYWDWSEIYKTSDGGYTWSQVTTPPASSRRGIHLALNPADENELWISIVSAGNGTKVYRTTDGGTNWNNLSTATLNGESIKDIQYIGGATAKVYIATNYGAYYYDDSSNSWQAFDTGLPFLPEPLQMRPFFRDGKIRMATRGRGIWETDLLEQPLPVAQPMTTTDTVFCSRDTIQLDCYSILNHNGASWQWTITPAPVYISSLTARNPKVVLGADGMYAIRLQVTDGNGASDSKTITNMIVVESNCEVDSLPGNALQTEANGDYAIVRDANLSNLTHFTTTAWIKPKGAQQAFAGIVSSGDWCAHCDYTEGLIFDYGSSRLWYKWPGNSDNWASNSGMTVPLDEWSYVALVITPDSAVLYLNENKYVHNISLNPGDIDNLHLGYGHYSKSFKGAIDEVGVWDRALTDQEIRELRHLTKEQLLPNDPTLIAYYQFNNLVGGTQVMDAANSYHATLTATASIDRSTAPIGSGSSQHLTVDASNTSYDFSQAGAKLYFNNCELPSGEMVVTRLNNSPTTSPNDNDNGNNYWLLNYYGDQANSFSFIDSLELTPSAANFVSDLSNPSDAVLHTRSVNADSSNWTTSASAKNSLANSLTYNRAISIDSSAQILLTNRSAAFNELTPENYCEADSLAGKSLECFGSGDYAQTPDFNEQTDTLTITAWIKPDGIQSTYAGIVMNDGTAGGMNFRENNNTLGYHWNGGWSWDSGLELATDEWSHVAMVVTTNAVTLYLNGIGVTHSRSPGSINLSSLKMGSYQGWNSRNFNGQLDEICIWTRALSQDEVRAMMHLTKEDEVGNDPKLIGYYQFNEPTSTIFDKSGNQQHGSFSGNAALAESTAPVGGGSSEAMTISAGGVYTFANTGLTLGFPTTGTYPNGEIRTYRINTQPDSLPRDQIVPQAYWIIQNYGSNASFSELDSIVFEGVAPLSSLHEHTPSLFGLHKRASNEHLQNWNNQDLADQVRATGNDQGNITFSANNGITSFSQFSISDKRGILLQAKVFLQGPYANGLMNDQLRSNNLIPTTEPYTALGFSHFLEGGGESFDPALFNTTGNDAIVDWVFLELRDANDPTVILHTRAALLQRDGDIVDTDGLSPVSFSQAIAADYYVAVKHRNHLGVMSLNAMSLSGTTSLIDFSSIATYGTGAQKDLGSGVMGMWSGDSRKDGVIKYNGSSNDRVDMLIKVGFITPNNILSHYDSADINMDGEVKYNGANSDRVKILLNVGFLTPNNQITEQLP